MISIDKTDRIKCMLNKTIVVFVFTFIAIGKISAQEEYQHESGTIQERTFWVGVSEHPDPIMRHHEAFLDAFMKYAQTSSAESVTSKSDNSEEAEKRILSRGNVRIETVSSVTAEGRETIVIAIGYGPEIEYRYFSSEVRTNENNISITTELDILSRHQLAGANQGATEACHEYSKRSVSDGGAVYDEFNYTCKSVNVKYEQTLH